MLIPFTMGDIAPEPDNALTVLEYTFTVVPNTGDFIPEITQDAPVDEMVLMILPLMVVVVAAPALEMPVAISDDAVASVLMVLLLIFKVVGKAELKIPSNFSVPVSVPFSMLLVEMAVVPVLPVLEIP